MSQTQAQNTVVTFTEEEQKKIAELTNNARIFKNMVLLFQSGLFSGNQYAPLAECTSAAQSLYNQTEAAIASIRQNASTRGSSAPKNGNGKKVKAVKSVPSDEETPEADSSSEA